jgi:hypothetical protein
MHIFINKEPVDIEIEEEKTVGDVLAGIDLWLAGSENRISGLQINDEPVGLSTMTQAFEQSLEHIDSLNIIVSTWNSLAVEALLNSRDDLSSYADGSDDKAQIKQVWEESAAARFLAEHIPDVFALLAKTLSGEASAVEMTQILDERVREFTDTAAEMCTMGKLVSSLAERLEELPLDIQTAQDRKVAETVRIFSLTVDKLLRIIRILRVQDANIIENVAIDDQTFSVFIENFTVLLGEFLTTYEANDVVLLGDLAEYELSPRLLKLYTAMGNIML